MYVRRAKLGESCVVEI